MKTATYHIFFNNLANPLRVRIISVLKNKEMCVGDLSSELKVEQSKLSHALSSMKECNLVKVRQNGKLRIYSINRKTLMPILNIIDNHAMEECGNDCKKCKTCRVELNSGLRME